MHARVESERDGKWGTLAGRTKPISYIPVETSTPLENRSRLPRVYYAMKEEQREAENCELSWLDFIFVISFVAQICRETRNVRSGFYLRLDSWFYDRTGKGTVYHLAVWREERRWNIRHYSWFDRLERPNHANTYAPDLHFDLTFRLSHEIVRNNDLRNTDLREQEKLRFELNTNRGKKYLHLKSKCSKSKRVIAWSVRLKKNVSGVEKVVLLNGQRENPLAAAYLKINSRASAWQAAVCNNVQLEALYHWPFANRNGMKRRDTTRGQFERSPLGRPLIIVGRYANHQL